MFGTLAGLLEEAARRNCAVPAFNVYNLETVLAVAEGATELGAPAVFAFGEGYLKGVSFPMITGLVREATEQYGLRAALHLDHAKDPENVRAALRHGFTSVMFDGSRLPFEQNMEKTAKLAREAHQAGASIEGELGCLNHEDGSGGEEASPFTDPAQAAVFVRETGVDALAVAVGNAHGLYKETPELRIGLIGELAEATGIPLVLHGGSGISEEQMRQAIQAGIRKVNINTELALAGTAAILAQAMDKPQTRLEVAMEKAREAMKTAVKDSILRLGWQV